MKLVVPSMDYEKELISFRKDFLDAGEGANTCGSLAVHENIQEWIDEVSNLSSPRSRSPRKQFIYLKEDNKIVGFLQIRYILNEEQEKYAGHVGYCICPSERRKGYAMHLLKDAIPICKSLGIEKILVCCDPNNEGSVRTIINNGGIFEFTVINPDKSTYINRYWIP